MELSSNFSFHGDSPVNESASLYALSISNESIVDVYELSGNTPFNDLLTKEEREALADAIEHREVRVEAISGLLSYLFKPVNDHIPAPLEVALRSFILAYTINPQLISNLSLSQIGEIFGGISRQALSARLLKNDKTLNIRAKSRKSDTARERFKAAALANWHDKKAYERYERKREYSRAYKSERREKLKAQNNEYYLKNRERILRKRREARRKNK